MGAFFIRECSTCNKDDCEDEGACKWRNGKCLDKKKEDEGQEEDRKGRELKTGKGSGMVFFSSFALIFSCVLYNLGF